MGLVGRRKQAIREYNDRLRFDLEQQDAEIKRLRDQCNQLDGLVEQRELQLEGAVEENGRLREAMVRCAEKLESWGNEEPVAVASYLRDHAAAGGERLGL